MNARILGLVLICSTPLLAQEPPAKKPRPYRLPGTDLKQRIIWDAQCKEPEGSGLAFGGQDQQGTDGRAGTRLFVNGRWELLIEKEPLARRVKWLDRHSIDRWQINRLGQERRDYLLDRTKKFEVEELSTQIRVVTRFLESEYAEYRIHLARLLHATSPITFVNFEGWHKAIVCPEYEARLQSARKLFSSMPEIKGDRIPYDWFVKADEIARLHSESQDLWNIYPPPRALAAIAYDPMSKLYVMFGGDHLDYLMNDTWVFDMGTKKWSQRLPKSAPPSRANHKLIAIGDGTITLKGGYTYSNNTDYMGGPYIDIADGDWVYDVAKNEWKGEGKGVPTCTRVYRKGPFHPNYFVQDPKPDAKAFAKWLDELPVNEWKKTNPPHLPQMNRDWGTAVLDPDHDMILRWAGGHSAHGGTDVLHFHLSTNRWELPFPVELPLGQTYANTEYPDGYNFNRRPWITGHTYQNYAYDAQSKLMVFTGRPKYSYFYDPVKGDWTGDRFRKLAGMDYANCFYTLTLTPTPHGLVCWTSEGKLFYNEQLTIGWTEVRTNGDKLPNAVVDNSTLAYDTKRDRLLFFVKGYGDKTGYSGEIHELDWKSLKVRKLAPEGMKEAAAVPYLCQIRYDPQNDLMLVGGTLPPDAAKFRRTPAYDCAKNRWVEMKITGDDPSGKNGRNVSLGLMYDAKRKLWWAVDARSQVFVLKLDAAKADVQALAQP